MKIKDIVIAGLQKGLSTEQIIANVKEVHPNAKTSPASVAWYKTQMRKEGTPPAPKTSSAPAALNKNAPQYELKNIKTFATDDGGAYSATLYRDGKKVAEVTQGGYGGPNDYHWLDEGIAIVKTRNYQDEVKTFKGTPEEALLHEQVFNKTFSINGETLYSTVDIFIDDLLNHAEAVKNVKRITKTKILFIEGSSAFTIKGTSKEALDHVKAKYPKAIILNGLPLDEAAKILADRTM